MGLIRDILLKNYSLSDFDRDIRLWIGGQPTNPGVTVSEETALRHITVYSCVRVRLNLLPAYLFHVPGLGFDGIKGYSIIRLAREAVGLGKACRPTEARDPGRS